MVNFALGPYQQSAILQHGLLFYDDFRDVVRLAGVCRQYRSWLDDKHRNLWQRCAVQFGLPQVASLDGKARSNPRFDLLVLSRVMISAKCIERLFGTVVGHLQPISEYWFNMFALKLPDPYEEGKLFCDNYMLMAEPAFIKRRVGSDTPLELTKDGKLVEVAPEAAVEREITIPFSLENLLVLVNYPRSCNAQSPVFTPASNNALGGELRKAIPEKLSTCVIRKAPLASTADLYLFDKQEAHVKSINMRFECASPRRCALFYAISILTNMGFECKDFYVAGSGSFLSLGSEHHLLVGNYKSGSGLDIYYGHDRRIRNVVLPTADAEIPKPLAVENDTRSVITSLVALFNKVFL